MCTPSRSCRSSFCRGLRAPAAGEFNAGPGFLVAADDCRLDSQGRAEATISGDVREDIDALGSSPSQADCQSAVDAALNAGRLTLKTDGDGQAAADVEQAVRDKAAQVLLQLATGSGGDYDAAALVVRASQSFPVHAALERTADIT